MKKKDAELINIHVTNGFLTFSITKMSKLTVYIKGRET